MTRSSETGIIPTLCRNLAAWALEVASARDEDIHGDATSEAKERVRINMAAIAKQLTAAAEWATPDDRREDGIRAGDAVTSLGGAPLAVRAWPGEYVVGLADRDLTPGDTIEFRGTKFRVGNRARVPPLGWCHPPGLCNEMCCGGSAWEWPVEIERELVQRGTERPLDSGHRPLFPTDGGPAGSGQTRPHETQQGAATPGQGATVEGAVPGRPATSQSRTLDPTAHRVEHPPSAGSFPGHVHVYLNGWCECGAPQPGSFAAALSSPAFGKLIKAKLAADEERTEAGLRWLLGDVEYDAMRDQVRPAFQAHAAQRRMDAADGKIAGLAIENGPDTGTLEEHAKVLQPRTFTDALRKKAELDAAIPGREQHGARVERPPAIAHDFLPPLSWTEHTAARMPATEELRALQSPGTARQPKPTPNGGPAIVDLVIEDLTERARGGELKYGVRLQPHSGRVALVDAYQEVLDLAQYIRQEIEERRSGLTGARNLRQAEIFAWTRAAFTVDQAISLPQRGLRLLEEAIEAFQAVNGNPEQAHRLVDYVFARPVGELGQELGGIGVCVLALAAAAGLSADAEERREVSRVLAKPLDELARRNTAKNAAGFLAEEGTPRSAQRSDTDRINWLGSDPDRLEDVRGRINNEGGDVRQAIDHLSHVEIPR